jgi:DNA transformation protein
MIDKGFVNHCLELLAPLGATRATRMFGGHGLYVDDLCVALLIGDALYLKVDDAHRAAFEAAGCKPFTYEMKKTGETKSISYYTAPDEAMESPAEMTPWGRRALSAAVAARAAKRPKKAPTTAKKTPAAGKMPVGKKAVAASKAPAAKKAAPAPKAAPKKAPARKSPARP